MRPTSPVTYDKHAFLRALKRELTKGPQQQAEQIQITPRQRDIPCILSARVRDENSLASIHVYRQIQTKFFDKKYSSDLIGTISLGKKTKQALTKTSKSNAANPQLSSLFEQLDFIISQTVEDHRPNRQAAAKRFDSFIEKLSQSLKRPYKKTKGEFRGYSYKFKLTPNDSRNILKLIPPALLQKAIRSWSEALRNSPITIISSPQDNTLSFCIYPRLRPFSTEGIINIQIEGDSLILTR